MNMTKDWNKNMRKRSHKRVTLLFPTLKEKITAEDLKRVFSYCVLNIAKKTNKSSSNFDNHRIAIGIKHD
jgi:hypothetical protein